VDFRLHTRPKLTRAANRTHHDTEAGATTHPGLPSMSSPGAAAHPNTRPRGASYPRSDAVPSASTDNPSGSLSGSPTTTTP